MNWSAAEREVRRLVAAGVVRRRHHETRVQGPLYEADPGYPGHLELRRFVLLAVGDAGRIRRALAPPAPTELAWIHGRYAEAVWSIGPIRLVVITPDVQGTREALGPLGRELRYALDAEVMSFAEWMARLQKREMRVLGIRRATRLWLIGNDEALREREHLEARARAARKEAIDLWREEAAWDDDFDPFARSY